VVCLVLRGWGGGVSCALVWAVSSLMCLRGAGAGWRGGGGGRGGAWCSGIAWGIGLTFWGGRLGGCGWMVRRSAIRATVWAYSPVSRWASGRAVLDAGSCSVGPAVCAGSVGGFVVV